MAEPPSPKDDGGSSKQLPAGPAAIRSTKEDLVDAAERTRSREPSGNAQDGSPMASQFPQAIRRTSTRGSIVSLTSSRLRSASIRLMESDPPLGMWAATAAALAKAPSLSEIRSGSFREEGWHHEGQLGDRRRKNSSTERDIGNGPNSRDGQASTMDATPEVLEEVPLSALSSDTMTSHKKADYSDDMSGHMADKKTPSRTLPDLPPDVHQLESGYIVPPKVPWTTSTSIALRSFWRWFLTPLGFLITVYGLNVVAWGGMLFLLLCGAAPAMCHPTCNDINSARRIWLEIDSQILNALFCVTGFGLIPWRFRDLYWLLVWRLGIRGRSREQREFGMRMLAGIHRDWFRLKGSEKWAEARVDEEHDPSVPLPLSKKLDPPLTGVRAEPTATWKMDYVIWCNVWNTFLQACLCGFMWGMNRYNRPSWATGFFIAIASVVAGAAGMMMYVEGKKVKKVEGVSVKQPLQKDIDQNV